MVEHDTAMGKHIGIVGAGAVGISCAQHLARSGHRVTLFDSRSPGAGASLGNSGIIAVSEVLPFSRMATLRRVPKMFLDPMGPLVIRAHYMASISPWLARFLVACTPQRSAQSAATLAMMLSGAPQAWQDMLRTSVARERLRDTGWLRVYDTPQALAGAMPDVDRQRALGVGIEIIGASQLQALEPALAPRFAGAAFCPGAWSLDTPLKVLDTLAQELPGHQVRIRRASISSIAADATSARLLTDTGEWHVFDHVVIAAGAWSRRLVRQLGADIPLDTERGYHLMLQHPPRALNRPVSINSPGYSLAPMEEGLRIATGVEFAGIDAAPDFRRVRKMAEHAATVIPGLDPRAHREWLGLRPSMPDSIPVIGPMRRHPNVILACGHGHLGLTLGPLTGQLVAEMVDGRPPSVDLAMLLPRI
jgi:D-amino-acid dehydrogenase